MRSVAGRGSVEQAVAVLNKLPADMLPLPAEPLRGPAAPSPWDPPLAGRMAQTGNAVMEERMIPLLLADIAESAP